MLSELASFVGLTICAAILWHYGVLTPRRLLALGILLSVVFVGWFWWRDHTSLRGLRELVQIPKVIDSTAVPNHRQMEALVSVMEKSPVKGWYTAPEDMRGLAERVREHKNPVEMWILVTPLTPVGVGDFYQSQANHPGWEVVANTAACCLLLRRGQYDMLVSFFPDRMGRGTQVVYVLNLEERKTAP
jgi:hypothetical protein